MLRVTYEIVPFGQEDHPNRRVIAVQKIGLQKNVDGVGHYVSALHDDADFPPANKVVTVINQRDTGAWPLVMKALEKHCDPDYRPTTDFNGESLQTGEGEPGSE